MTTTNPPWTNNNGYEEFNDKAGLQEVAKVCIGYVAADLMMVLVWRAATSGLRRLWGGGPATWAGVIVAPG
jgi:hypothetical protein